MRTLALAGVVLALAACGDETSHGPGRRPAPATTGAIRGICRYVGREKPITLPAIPGMGCNGPHEDGSLRRDESNALADCVVSIEEAPPSTKPSEGRLRIVIEPCELEPRTSAAIVPVQVDVENRARGETAIHGYRGDLAHTAFNFAVAPGTTQTDRATAFLERPGQILLQSDIQPGYFATIHLFEHPWFDVTALPRRDGRAPGEYRLDAVPPGEYDVVCWHEGIARKPISFDGKIASYEGAPPLLARRHVRVVAGETASADFDVGER